MSRPPRSKGSHKGPDPADAGDAAVGYGRPPLHSRFQKGKSGNPLGRPPKASLRTRDHMQEESHTAAFERVLLETVTANAGGQRKVMSKAEAIQRAQEKQAFVDGKVLPTAAIKKDLLALDAQRHAEIEEDHAYWQAYVRRYHENRAAAERMGRSLTGFRILPEDIDFIPGERVRIRGPHNTEELADHVILQKVLQAFYATAFERFVAHGNALSEQQQEDFSVACFICSLLDRVLSTRMAAENGAHRHSLEHIARADTMQVSGTQSLRTEVTSAWAALGLNPPKACPFPRLMARFRPRVRQLVRDIHKDPVQRLLHGDVFRTARTSDRLRRSS